jgi:hypothetical protein
VDNTSKFLPAQSVPPLYAWPKPGAIPEVNVAWADWIRLWSAEIDRCSGGLPGLWLANAVGALALQAEALGDRQDLLYLEICDLWLDDNVILRQSR